MGLLTLGEPGAPNGAARLRSAISEALQQRLDGPSGFSSYGEVQSPRPLRLFYQDESRVGLPARLTGGGIKPIQPYAPLYQYYWLYTAVEPSTGERCWCERPHLDPACFQAFLEHLSWQYPHSLNLWVVGRAPAHTAHALCLPDNILLLMLPPYSPGLNPIER